MPIIVPEILPYLFAILALLLIWQVHNMLVTAGRIEAKNFWDESNIRMLINVTPEDAQTCDSCREVNRTVVLPAMAARKNFSPLHSPCKNPAGCRCQLIGIYGGWAEAQRVLQILKDTPGSKPIKLSEDKLSALLGGSWQTARNGMADRASVHMLEAIRAEGKDIELALKRYQAVIDGAKTARDLVLVIPAYMRMLEILERAERTQDALNTISRIEKLSNGKPGSSQPTHDQREHVSLLKTRLTAVAQRTF